MPYEGVLLLCEVPVPVASTFTFCLLFTYDTHQFMSLEPSFPSIAKAYRISIGSIYIYR